MGKRKGIGKYQYAIAQLSLNIDRFPQFFQIAYSVTISQEQEAKDGTNVPPNQSTPRQSSQTAPNVPAPAAPMIPSGTDPRGKKRKATGEASSEAIDLEYAEEEEEDIVGPVADASPAKIVDDSEDIE